MCVSKLNMLIEMLFLSDSPIGNVRRIQCVEARKGGGEAKAKGSNIYY